MTRLSKSWIEKYKPKKIDEIICNIPAVHQIKNWLNKWNHNRNLAMKIKMEQDKKKKKKTSSRKKRSNQRNKFNLGNSCMIITGSHGSGKTVIVDVVTNECNYEIKKIDFNMIKLGNNINDYIKKLIKNLNVLEYVCDKKKKENKNIMIVIDEVESITSTNEKKCIYALQKANDINWFCPIIFISNNQHNKLLSEIKKKSLEVVFRQPEYNNMKMILNKIVDKEKINLEKNNRNIKKILNHCQSDMRRLIYTLQDIQSAYGDEFIDGEKIDEYCKGSNKKDVDINLFKATNELLYNYKSIDDCLRLYELEKVLLPLMVHQHYIESIIINYNDINEQYRILSEVSDSLSTGDVVENYIYGDQSWEMQEIHGFHTCVASSYHLCENLKNNPIDIVSFFAQDLNKTSIKRINKKNIIKTDVCFKNMDVSDYIFINKIVRKLIKNNKIKECVEMMDKYNIQVEQIKSLLKIDKIIDVKTPLSSKHEKEFKKLIHEHYLETKLVDLLKNKLLKEFVEISLENNLKNKDMYDLIDKHSILLIPYEKKLLDSHIKNMRIDKKIIELWMNNNLKNCAEYCMENSRDIKYVENLIKKNNVGYTIRKEKQFKTYYKLK